MANIPHLNICTAASRDDINRLFDAMGDGPNSFSRKLCSSLIVATPSTPATHYMLLDMQATTEDKATWTAMAADGDLPAINGTYGEDGVISSQDAQAALTFGNLLVCSAAGLLNTQEAVDGFVAGILACMSLQLVPGEGL